MQAIPQNRFLDEEERRRLMTTCRDKAVLDVHHGRIIWPTRWMLVDLGLQSGLRAFEMAALRIGDLRLRNGKNLIHVRRGKRSKPRDVWINSELTRHLREFIEWKQKSVGIPVEPESFLLSNRRGEAFTPMALHLSFKAALKAAGLTCGSRSVGGHTIHDLRHTYASLAMDSGDIGYVQRQLGHTQITFTGLYLHSNPERNAELAEGFKLFRSQCLQPALEN